jgi:hypothetical protein
MKTQVGLVTVISRYSSIISKVILKEDGTLFLIYKQILKERSLCH